MEPIAILFEILYQMANDAAAKQDVEKVEADADSKAENQISEEEIATHPKEPKK